MSFGQKTLTVKGGADNLKRLRVEIDATVKLTDGTYNIAEDGILWLYNWNSVLEIAKDAVVNLAPRAAHTPVGTEAGTSSTYSKLYLNGGRINVGAAAIPSPMQIAGVGSMFIMANDAVYDDTGVRPQFLFNPVVVANYRQGYIKIVDSTFLQTNCNDASIGMLMHPHNSTVAVTNATLMFPQMYCGTQKSTSDANREGLYLGTYYGDDRKANDSTFTFHDCTVKTGFRPGSVYNGYNGIFTGTNSVNNTFVFDGPKNAYSGGIFSLSGSGNTLRMKDGTFEAWQYFDVWCGKGLAASFTGGRAALGTVRVWAKDSALEISDAASVTASKEMTVRGDGSRLAVTGGGSLAMTGTSYNYIELGGKGNAFDVSGEGTVVTGKINFVGTGGRVTVSDGARYVAMRSETKQDNFLSGVRFAPGTSNNVLVISNATFESAMPLALQAQITTLEGPKADAVPFTNVPNSRIELRGSNARFIISSNAQYGKDNPWYSCALGEMLDHSGPTSKWTAAAYKLDNPLRVRFCLPKDGYAEAPFQVNATIAVVGGNAEFEFDASEYEWKTRTTDIPLLYNSWGFSGWNYRLYINVAQLNETNADRLPVNYQGQRAKFVLSADGKTLMLRMPGTGGFHILVR